jgi:chemotaxis signal transduction protein
MLMFVGFVVHEVSTIVEHWWNDTDAGEQKISEKTLF